MLGDWLGAGCGVVPGLSGHPASRIRRGCGPQRGRQARQAGRQLGRAREGKGRAREGKG